jgi:hypothetical protein
VFVEWIAELFERDDRLMLHSTLVDRESVETAEKPA